MSASEDRRVKLSVVIAASHGASALKKCLASLEPQAQATDAEVIVVTNYDCSAVREGAERLPGLNIIVLPPNTTVPDLRTRGINLSQGEIVALAEDHCCFGANWCSEIKRAHESSHPVIGGSVENDSDARALDWAVYLYDYGRYMLPNREGIVDSLPGNNVSYKRSILQAIEPKFRNGFFETFIHWEIQNQGYPLFMMPSAVVIHQQRYRLGASLVQSYHHGRLFAGKRAAAAPLPKRIMMMVGSSVLPILLPVRIFLRSIRKRRKGRETLGAIPYLFLLMAAWSVGEFLGYSRGEGQSGARWT